MSNGISFSLEELIALREKANSLKLTPRKRVKNICLSDHPSTLRGRGIDFAEVRTYQAGDDTRHMDWRVTARTGKPHIKLYQEERERPVFIVVDLTPSMFFGTKVAFKSCIATEVAALLGWAAVNNGDKLGGLVIFSDEELHEFTPLTRQHGILPLLKILANQSKPHQDHLQKNALSRTLLHLRRIAKPNSLIFIISDFNVMSPNTIKHLSLLRKHTEIVAFSIHDPIEFEPPRPGLYTISNGQKFTDIDTRNRAWRTNYKNKFERQHQHVLSVMRQHQIPLIQMSTQSNVHQVLFRAFGGL